MQSISKTKLQFYQLSKPYYMIIIHGPVIAVLVFFCTAVALMALQKSAAASTGSETGSENSLCLWGSFSTRLCISGFNLYIYFHSFPLTIDT